MQRAIGVAYGAFVRRAELVMSLVPPLAHVYSRLHAEMVRAEAREVGITRRSHVLCVGGGYVPHTAIRLARETGATVHIIDNRGDVIERSERIMRAFLADRANLRLKHADALSCDLGRYDCILIAATVSPKEAVVRRICDDAAPTTKVVFRELVFAALPDLGGLLGAEVAPVGEGTLTGLRKIRNRLSTERSYIIRWPYSSTHGLGKPEEESSNGEEDRLRE
jgi:Alanine dehydrogenase/PNT, C-terminal domain